MSWGIITTLMLALSAQGNDLDRELADVLPTRRGNAYRLIEWKSDLLAARTEAKATGKPLFLWVMDGHPLGCT